MNYVLLTILAIEVLFFYFISGKNIMNPSNVFAIIFLIPSVFLAFDRYLWEYQISGITVLVITLGVFVFGITCCIIEKLFAKFNKATACADAEFTEIQIPKTKLVGFTIFNIMIVILVWTNIMQITKKYDVYTNMFDCVAQYRLITLSHVEAVMNVWVRYLYLFCRTSSYVWIYLFLYNYIASKKISVWLIINCILTVGSYLLSGARGNAVYAVLSSVPLTYMLICKKMNSIQTISRKMMAIYLSIIGIIIMTYKVIGVLIGRSINGELYHHIACYLFAPIINLDMYLNGTREQSTYWGQSTFQTVYVLLGRKFGVENLVNIEEYNIFQTYNGLALGNVCTAFLPFFRDNQWIGLIFYTAFMAIIMQMCYECIKIKINNRGNCNLLSIIYARLFIFISFSFFASIFYEKMFTSTFLMETIIIWLLFWGLVDKFRARRKVQ